MADANLKSDDEYDYINYEFQEVNCLDKPNFKIYIQNCFKPNDKSYNPKLTKTDMFLYAAIQPYKNYFMDSIILSMDLLFSECNIKSKKKQDSIISSFYKLLIANLIEWENPMHRKITKDDILKIKLSQDDDSRFTLVDMGIIYEIMTSKEGIQSKESMIMIVIALESFRNNNMQYSYPSFQGLSDTTCGMSTRTISNNLEKLHSLGILHYGSRKFGKNNIYVLCDQDNPELILSNAIKKSTNTTTKTKKAPKMEIRSSQGGFGDIWPFDDIPDL